MLFLSIVFIGSLALLLPDSIEAHKKIIIHIPLEVREKHHTHTIYKHVYHKDDHKHGWESAGSSSNKGGWKKEPWKKEKWSAISESNFKDSSWHETKKNPHRISSFIPNYNDKKLDDIFKRELDHKHRGSRHKEYVDSFENDEDFGSSEYSEEKKNPKLSIAKVIKHTVFHDHE